MTKTGGGGLNDFFHLKVYNTLDEDGSSPKVIWNIHGEISWEITSIWCSTLGWKDGKGCSGSKVRKPWPCLSLVLCYMKRVNYLAFLQSVTPGAYHKLMYLLSCRKHETWQTQMWHWYSTPQQLYSNTGIHKRAAKLLEKLGRKVFFLACHHYVLELIHSWCCMGAAVWQCQEPWHTSYSMVSM